MALLKFGSIITEGSGSLGGHTIQHSKGGMQLRTKPIPHGNPSASQTLIRSINQQLQAGWRALTPSQQKIWNDWPVTHGIQAQRMPHNPISGHSLWMQFNFYNLFNGDPLQLLPYAPAPIPNLISSWSNIIAHPFETFVSDGVKITSAINVTADGSCYSLPYFEIFGVEQYRVDLNWHVISGFVNFFVLGDQAAFLAYSDYFRPPDGVSSFVLTTYAFRPNISLIIYTDNPASFSISDVILTKI